MATTSHITSMVVLTAATFVLQSTPSFSFNCSSRIERGDMYEQCFNNQSLQIPDVIGYYKNSPLVTDPDDTPVDQMYIAYGKELCKTQDSLKAAVRCAHEKVDMVCADADTAQMQPSGEDVATSVEYYCLPHVNFSCAVEYRPLAIKCVETTKMQEIQEATSVDALRCVMFHGIAECMKKIYNKPCGCTTTKAFSDLSAVVFPKSSCPQKVNRVMCKAGDPKAFASDGLGGTGSRQAVTFGLLAASLLVAILKI